MSWFITPKQKFYAGMLVLLTVIFGALTFVSLKDGAQVFNEKFYEAQFEQPQAKLENVKSFDLKSASLCRLDIKGLTLNQSWLWAKVTVLDEKNRPVLDYKFNLSYYHGYEGGESWSEGDKDDYKMMRLPKGKYRVMVYGEDEPDTSRPNRFARKGYSTINRNEAIQISVSSGVWMTRYFLILFIVFLCLTCLYFYIRSERSQYENPVTYEGYGDQSQAQYEPYPTQDPNQPYNPNNPNQNV